ncbi:MAG: acyl carrier protein [Ruminococcaceae bacterium]|nr:acyl carrier protein [Oscillospiraceae bacterium]
MMFEKMKPVIAEQLGVDPDKITPDASFIDDLGADSLDMVELILAIEEEYGFEVSEDDAAKISTVGEACDYIKKAIGE